MLAGVLAGFAVFCFCLFWGTKKNNILIDQSKGTDAWGTFTKTVSPLLLTVFPRDVWEMTEKKLIWAGIEDWSPLDFLAIKIAGGIFIPVIVGLFSFALGIDPIYLLALVLIGYMFPNIILKRKVEARQKAIRKDLYEFELLLLTVISAGMEIMEAIKIVGQYFGGEIKKEIDKTVLDMNLGSNKRQALEKMSQRIGIDEMAKLINVILQADRYGGENLTQSMAIHVSQMRIDRMNAAQKVAEKAKVKIMIPIFIWILIPLFVLILYPMLTQFQDF